jgi:hypothetical protein
VSAVCILLVWCSFVRALYVFFSVCSVCCFWFVYPAFNLRGCTSYQCDMQTLSRRYDTVVNDLILSPIAELVARVTQSRSAWSCWSVVSAIVAFFLSPPPHPVPPPHPPPLTERNVQPAERTRRGVWVANGHLPGTTYSLDTATCRARSA